VCYYLLEAEGFRCWLVNARDYTRLRTDLTHNRSRQVQRLAKLLEDALIKLVGGGHRHHGRVRTRHDRGADRRAAGFEGARRAGPRPDED
jgi:indole-3-glycerol phosphate synthase